MRSSPQADAAMVAVAKMEPLAQRMAEPSEMAKVVLFLGSNESSYLTGGSVASSNTEKETDFFK